MNMNEVIRQFKDAMAASGIRPPESVFPDGKIHRFSVNDNSHGDSGWYVLYGDGVPAGAFGVWGANPTEKWRADIGRKLTQEEEHGHHERMVAIMAARKAEEDRRHSDAAEKAAAIWNVAHQAEADHPYLIRKNVKPVITLREIAVEQIRDIIKYFPKSSGETLRGRLLVVPMKAEDKVSTLELIDEDGRKTALAGGAKAGGYWAAQPLPAGDGADSRILIGEGVATVLSAKEATGHHVVAALCCSNLPKVAATLRKRFPAAQITVLADIGNGQQDAEHAARVANGTFVAPDFTQEEQEKFQKSHVGKKPTDFNDLADLRGLEGVGSCIEASTGTSGSGVDQSPCDVARCEHDGGVFEVSGKGVYFVPACIEDQPPKPARFICSSLRVIAKTRDASSKAWGRLLEWKDADGVLHRWAMPLELLQGDGTEFRRELARSGLYIAPNITSRNLLSAYLQVWPVEQRARCVDRLGWQDDVFVLPNAAVGKSKEVVVFQSTCSLEPAFKVRGTVDEWKSSVARLAIGNSRLIFSISMAFGGALLRDAGIDSGGIHYRGMSSIGKTISAKGACSVWGHHDGYKRQWRATINGLEGLCHLHNDGFLVLDDIDQASEKDVGDSAYMIANESSKNRADRNGAARKSVSWRLLFLSNGEHSLADIMRRAGKSPNAGQEIRLADIPADAGMGMGAFEELHGIPTSAQFAEEVVAMAGRFYGAVGIEWLRRLVAHRTNLSKLIREALKQFVADVVPPGASGQIERVARRFALIGFAGELATHFGLTDWPENEALKAAKALFGAWLQEFGGIENQEERKLLNQVREFFEHHGSSRFQPAKNDKLYDDTKIINRVGFWRDTAVGERQYLVLPESFKNEIAKGFNSTWAGKTLVARGWIVPDHEDRPTQKTYIAGFKNCRVYIFSERMWKDDDEN